MKIRHKLQYISQGLCPEKQLEHISLALDHGVEWVQLRWKNAEPKAWFELAEQAKRLCETYQATYIVNDSIVVAQAVDADGVHLGLEDSTVTEARRALGSTKIIGGTANTLSDVQQRITEGCDYIGLGPYRTTATKSKLSPVLGLRGYRTIIEQLQTAAVTPPPIYAIGGIGLDDIPALMDVGIQGIALSQAITAVPASIMDFKRLLA